MEDKTFDLLEKMYAEFSSRFDKVENRFDKVENRLDKVEGHITRIEMEHGKKLNALFDGYKQTYEKLQEHDKRLDGIETKVDSLSIRISGHDSILEVLEGGRKK